MLLLVFFATVSIIGYNSFTEALMSQYSEGAFLTAETAGRRLDADRMEEYARSGGATPEYLEAWNEMDELCNSTGATFIYVIQPDTTANTPNTTLGLSVTRQTMNTGRNTARCMNWRRTVNW